MSVLLAFIALLLLLIVSGVVYQAIGAARDARRYPPPGQLVDIGGHRLHVYETGGDTPGGMNGPTVVLESGVASSCMAWKLVQPEVSKFARVCSYDRAGLGWSDPGPLPRTARRSVEELHELLHRGAIPGPYVLVGHSYGGFVARLFAATYPSETAGLVLVDSIHPPEWFPLSKEKGRVLRRGVQLSRRGAVCARLGINRLCLTLLNSNALGLPRLVVNVATPGTMDVASRIVGEVKKLPDEVRPVLRALWSQAKCFHSMADYLESIPESAAEVAASGRLGDIPAVVISAAAGASPRPGRSLGTAAEERRKEHEDAAQLSTNGRHIIAPNSGHWVQLDQPELVIAAIREVVESYFGGASAGPRDTEATARVCSEMKRAY